MHDTLVRVFVVAVGLLTCPRDNPGVQEEWNDAVTSGMQRHEERLLSEKQKLDQEMMPVGVKITLPDNKGPDQHASEKHKLSDLEDVTVPKPDSEEDYSDHKSAEHFVENSDPSGPPKSTKESEVALNTSQTDQITPQDQQEKLDEREVIGSNKQETPLSGVHTQPSENETSEKEMADWEEGYLWYIWNIVSIISMIRVFRRYLRNNSQMKQDDTRSSTVTHIASEVPLPNSEMLQNFHSTCIRVSSDKKWREDEFLEGFANQMVEAMSTVCNKNGGMMIKNCQMLGAYNIIVPFTPPEPYRFESHLLNNQAKDLLPDTPVCGQVKVVENTEIQNGCPCQSSDADDDMVCLLHCESKKVKTKAVDVYDGLLCQKNSPFLSKSRVTRWFQSTITQAWALISHKYEFELSIRYIDAPGALAVRFRSGKKISFSMNPVIKVNTDAHFYITPCSPNNLDTLWTLSMASYEDRFLKRISERLPADSCHIQTLNIACFLHKRQTALSQSSSLKDFHFKTALMYLLLTKDPAQWKPNFIASRLRDLLAFMERSLEEKQLHHIFIGNPLTQKIIQLPAEFTQAKPVNLFHPLVVHNCIYRNALMHFQEMLRNTHMLICDYTQCTNSSSLQEGKPEVSRT